MMLLEQITEDWWIGRGNGVAFFGECKREVLAKYNAWLRRQGLQLTQVAS